jgi:hypothetical protein
LGSDSGEVSAGTPGFPSRQGLGQLRPQEAAAVAKMVATVIAGVVRGRPYAPTCSRYADHNSPEGIHPEDLRDLAR